MQNRRETFVVAALAVVVGVVLFIVLSGGDDESDTTSSTATETTADVPTIVVKDGQAVGGVQELEFSQGDEIRFEVESDEDAEIHFHGYDIAKEVKAGGGIEYAVPATIPGVFEVEIEDTATEIAEITVD